MSPVRSGARPENQGLGSDTAWAIVLEAVRVGTTLVSFMLLGRSLGAEGYGNYAALYAIIGPVGALAASGVGLALLEHIIRDNEDAEATFRSCLSLALVFGLLLTGLSTIIATLIVDLRITTILTVLGFEMVTFPAFVTATNLVRVHEGFGAAAGLRAGAHLAKVAVLVALFTTDSLTLATFGLANLVVTAALAIVSVKMVGRRYRIAALPGRIDRRHLKTSAVYSAGITGLALQTDGDKLLLASYGQTAATGVYSAAYRVVQMGLLPVMAVVAATHDRFLNHDANQQGQHIRRALVFSRVALLYGVAVGSAMVVVAPLLPVFVGDEFDESVEIVRWLAPLVAVRGLAIFPLNGLMGLGKTALRTVLLLLSAALSIGIYIWLIPTYSWRGAVVGTMVGEVALAIAAWGYLVHHQRLHDRSLAGDELAATERGLSRP